MKIRVMVLCGGPDNESSISLDSGLNIYLNGIDRRQFDPVFCFIDKDKKWFIYERFSCFDLDSQIFNDQLSFKKISFTPVTFTGEKNGFKELGIDVVFNTLHGSFGEGGELQAILDYADVKYTGSGLVSSALTMNKVYTNKIVSDFVRVPKEFSLQRDNFTKPELDKKLYYLTSKEVVIKPVDDGSSFGIVICKNENHSVLCRALDLFKKNNKNLIVQEKINGLEVTCPIIGRGKYAVTLPVGSIKYDGEFFDYENKYNGKAVETFPALIPDHLTSKIQEISMQIHNTFDCRGITRSDFIITSKNDIYFLEINTCPGMTGESLAPKSSKAHGWSYKTLVTKIIQSTFQ
jgi:D-alanine-D-alanine ligase